MFLSSSRTVLPKPYKKVLIFAFRIKGKMNEIARRGQMHSVCPSLEVMSQKDSSDTKEQRIM